MAVGSVSALGRRMRAPREDSSRAASLVFSAGFVCLLWLLVALATLYLADLSLRSFLIIADASVLVIPLLVKISSGALDLFEPLIVLDVALAAMMILRPLADIANRRYIEHGFDFSSSFDRTLALVLLANVCCQIGYFSGLPYMFAKVLPYLRADFDVKRTSIWASVLAVSGVVFYSIFLATQGGVKLLLVLLAGRSPASNAAHENSSGYLYGTIALLIPAALSFFSLWIMRRRLIYLICSIASAAPYMILVGAQGNRSGMIALIFGFPLLWYLFKGKRPSAATLLISAFLLIAVFGIIRTHRNAKSRANSPSSGQLDPIQAAVSVFDSDDDEMFDVTALEVETVPRIIPMRPFGVVTDIFFRALPRPLFPDKPVDMDTRFFSAMWPRRAKATGGRGGTASSIVGDFYLDSGSISVVIWMFILGAMLKTGWVWYQANGRSPNALLIYSIAPTLIVQALRGTLQDTMAWSCFTLFPLILLPYVQRIRIHRS